MILIKLYRYVMSDRSSELGGERVRRRLDWKSGRVLCSPRKIDRGVCVAVGSQTVASTAVFAGFAGADLVASAIGSLRSWDGVCTITFLSVF